MCKSSDTIAHDLFYTQDAQQERQSPKGRFSIHRGRDFTVAYSYTTPIAVYPDDGDFVLLDANRFSNTTSGHQSSIRQAIPYNVRCIECDWLGENDIWRGPQFDIFEKRFRKFIQVINRKVNDIGKSDGDYAYSRQRIETLNRLNGLRCLAEVSSIRKTLLTKLERRMLAINDGKRIQSAQKRIAKRRASEKKRKQKRQLADQFRMRINRLFRENERVKATIAEAAEQMLQRFPYHQWRWLSDALQEPRGEESRQILEMTRNAVRDAAVSLWSNKYGKPPHADDCDIRWHRDGLFHTTKGVAIPYAELQRCLELWKKRRFLGDVVNNRYHVLCNDEDMLIIGCHRFRQETVQQIWERYAGKTPKTIAHEETVRQQENIDYINQVMQPLLKLVRREYRNNYPTQTTEQPKHTIKQ